MDNNGHSQVNFQELMVNLLSKLSEREQEIIKQRFYLTSDLENYATLQEIGRFYNITRERVRQIESEALRKLADLAREKQFADDLKSLEQLFVAYLEKNGGLVREDYLINNFIQKKYQLDFLHPNAYLFAVEHFFDSAEQIKNHDSFYAIWKLNSFNLESVVELINKLEKHFNENENKNPQSREEMLGIAKKHLSTELDNHLQAIIAKHNDLTLEQLIESYLHSTSKLETNIMEQWGPSAWENIRPKKLGDKIYLAFLKHQEPLHFRELAEKINCHKFDSKKICPATVHNELISNDKFVLIGRGVYALKDWGYSEGTVADIITRILQLAGQPLTKEEIFNQVLNQRKVNPSTIYLSLINRNKFERQADGKYGLKK